MTSTSVQDDVEAARRYAVEMHEGQLYGGRPYIYHLDAVASALASFGPTAQVIGYLHDVVEDTGATVQAVRERFGSFNADAVALLTDEPGATRKERKARTYAKLSTVTGPLELALVAKVADRLSNVRECLLEGNVPMWDVYRGEHAAFRAAAFRPGRCDDMWAELNALLAPTSRPTSSEA